jgi:hypothetical protein
VSDLTINGETRPADVGPGIVDELEELTAEIVTGWYGGRRVDWEDVWDRLDGTELKDGRVLNIEMLDSPLQRELKKRIRKATA